MGGIALVITLAILLTTLKMSYLSYWPWAWVLQCNPCPTRRAAAWPVCTSASTGSGRVPVYLCAEQTPVQRPFVWRSIRLPSYELVVDRDVTPHQKEPS